ncbi:hypothetical protein IV203_023327 [Nitzschia inconspicua]|uniref:Uncharacterized protein n=1 Tax=Nitzschia inconspicua TaxID=303405 RepID=A0A9K3KDF5_9STRA|nr:hypothetical protein IV203_023327 [Nitzschia inconspicua]
MVALMLKECLILQARLLSQNNHHEDGLSDDRRNCAWIVASNLTPRLTQRNITAGVVEHILERVKEALDLDKIQNKMLAHTDISNRRSTVKSAIESAAKRCPPSRTNLNYSPWEMFIFVRRKTTWEYIHISHVCYKDDAGEVTIQSTVYHEENSPDTAHFSFQEVKQALIDILDDYSRQYHDLGTGSITPCPSGGLFTVRQIAYLASVQLFRGREDGKVVPDELLQNFETYVKTYIENSSTETTSTLIECGKCRTWNVSPGGFIFRMSDQFFCKFLGRTCYGGSSHGNALFLSKKRKISKRESQESATERFVAELWSSSEVTDSLRLGNDLISDPPDTKFKTKDNWGETCIENSMFDRQSPNYLIPPGIIGSPLTCRKPKAAFINECPWCEQVFSVNGEYDLLSDLHNFNFKTKDTKQFVSHEKKRKLCFLGSEDPSSYKVCPQDNGPTFDTFENL